MPPIAVEVPDQARFWNDWHRRRGATGNDEVHQYLRRMLLESLPRKADILDLGCGAGHDVIAFVHAGHSVSAIDFAPLAVRRAKRAVSRLPVGKRDRARIHEGDLAEQLPFVDVSFDAIYSHLALHYFDENVTSAIFAEIWRVTRPGGVLVFSVKSAEDPYFGKGLRLGDYLYCRKGHLRHFFTEQYTKELLESWQDVRIETYAGRYASPEHSIFIRAFARKPD